MRGIVQWFDKDRRYGFLKDEAGHSVFFHYSDIQVEGRKILFENDIVEFECGEGMNGRKKAINVKPVLTIRMIKAALREKGLRVRFMEASSKKKLYVVISKDGTIQTDKSGITFSELAAYAGMHYSMKFPT